MNGRFYYLNIVFCALISLNYWPAIASPWHFFAVSISAGLLVLLFYVAAVVTSFAVLLLPTLILSRWSKIITLILASVLAYLLTLDTIVYHLFHFHAYGVLTTVVGSGDVSQVFILSWHEYVLAIALLLAIALIELGLWRWSKKKRLRKNILTPVAIIVVCAFIAYFCVFYAATLENPNARGNSLTYQIISEAKVVPFLNNMFGPLIPGGRGIDRLQLAGDKIISSPSQLKAKLTYPLQPLHCQLPHKPLNFVIIFLDGWRGDEMNAKVSPNINRFAQQNWQFLDHSSGGNCTGPGTFSFFYSLPYAYWDRMVNHKQGPVLISQLLKDHYQMGIFKSATMRFPALDKTVFVDVPHLQLETPGKLPSDRDIKITQEFQQFIKKRKSNKPFFSFLFYDATHTFCEPEHFPIIFKPQMKVCSRFDLNEHGHRLAYLNRYRNAIHFDDSLVGKVLATLRAQHLLKNTVVMISADHGNEFNDNGLGYWGHASDYTIYQLHVPMIVHWPGAGAQQYHYATNHYQIAPFLMHKVLGCSAATNDYSVAEHSMLSGKPWAYIVAQSYIDQAFLTPHYIYRIYPTGNYIIKNRQGFPVANVKFDVKGFEKLLKIDHKW